MKKLFVILIAFAFMGCAASISRPDVLNDTYGNLIEGSKRLAERSEFSVAYIEAALGTEINKFPVEVQSNIRLIVATIQKAKGENRLLTDTELGTISGCWDRLIFLMSPEVVKQVTNLISPLIK